VGARSASAFFTTGTGSFPGLRRPDGGAGHPHASVRCEWVGVVLHGGVMACLVPCLPYFVTDIGEIRCRWSECRTLSNTEFQSATMKAILCLRAHTTSCTVCYIFRLLLVKIGKRGRKSCWEFVNFRENQRNFLTGANKTAVGLNCDAAWRFAIRTRRGTVCVQCHRRATGWHTVRSWTSFFSCTTELWPLHLYSCALL